MISIARFKKISGTISLYIVFVSILSSCSLHSVNIDEGQEVTVEQSSFSFDDKNYDFFSEYRISPGDQLDVLFSIQSWEQEVEYKLTLGDTLEIKFLNAPAYNQTQKIRPDGTISLPFIGQYEASGKSAETIHKDLMLEYAKVFKNPEITVLVPEYLTQLRELKTDLHTATRGLSRLVTVRPDGYTTFPMLGEFEVGAKTIKEVASALNLKYAKISPSLKVDLFLEKHGASVFYALGEVNDVGAHEISRPVSVAEALSLAKGQTEKADIEEVLIFRKQNRKMVATRINLADMMTVAEDTKMFFIHKDDIIYVPEAGSSQVARMSKRIMDIIMFRGWSVNWGFNTDVLPQFGDNNNTNTTITAP